MSDFNFIPSIGMKTNDCYLHGIGDNENICNNGIIRAVGLNWFVLEDIVIEEPILVKQSSYWVIGETDFYI